MLDATQDALNRLFGDIPSHLTAWNMAWRALITFVVTVAVIRLGSKRLFGKGTAFDTVVAIMIGSVMSRAITGSGAGTMIATWIGGAVLVALHWFLGWLSYQIDSFGSLVKGHEVVLVRDGEVQGEGMARTSTTQRDLERAARESANIPDISRIRLAVMERDGSISVVPASSDPRIIEIEVEKGVQTVRISLE